jgi:hypothetical protein
MLERREGLLDIRKGMLDGGEWIQQRRGGMLARR